MWLDCIHCRCWVSNFTVTFLIQIKTVIYSFTVLCYYILLLLARGGVAVGIGELVTDDNDTMVVKHFRDANVENGTVELSIDVSSF